MCARICQILFWTPWQPTPRLGILTNLSSVRHRWFNLPSNWRFQPTSRSPSLLQCWLQTHCINLGVAALTTPGYKEILFPLKYPNHFRTQVNSSSPTLRRWLRLQNLKLRPPHRKRKHFSVALSSVPRELDSRPRRKAGPPFPFTSGFTAVFRQSASLSATPHHEIDHSCVPGLRRPDWVTAALSERRRMPSSPTLLWTSHYGPATPWVA